jgi:hypothetical protein
MPMPFMSTRDRQARAYRLRRSPAEASAAWSIAARFAVAIEEAGRPHLSVRHRPCARALRAPARTRWHDRAAAGSHIVFEPDGAMLKLPINLLVMDDASVAAYRRAPAIPMPMNMTSAAPPGWAAAMQDHHFAVAPSGVPRCARARRSDARTRAYLGLGENLPVGKGIARCQRHAQRRWRRGPVPVVALTWATRSRPTNCAGGHPLGRAAPRTMLTGGDSPTALKPGGSRRIPHPALRHPRPCHRAPARMPAAPGAADQLRRRGSDGLLSFAEIFDLRLDADLVILSACTHRQRHGLAASREAG